MTKKDRAEISAEFNKVIKALEKEYGDEFITQGPRFERAKPIPTGSLLLDTALGIGGIARGRIIEIFGPEHSGKTSLSILILKKLLETYPDDTRPILIIDVEHSIDADFLREFGLDPELLYFSYPKTAEQALNTLVNVCETGAASAVLLDSIDGLQTDAFLKKSIGEADMGGPAKMIGQAIRQVSKSVVEHETTLLCINQIRDSLNQYGPKKVTPGGNALKFYASQRLELKKQQPSDLEGCFQMPIAVIKNKCGKPVPWRDDIRIDFRYAKGPDEFADLLTTAKQVGTARAAGVATYWTNGEGVEAKLGEGGGVVGAQQWLAEHPDAYKLLREATMARATTLQE